MPGRQKRQDAWRDEGAGRGDYYGDGYGDESAYAGEYADAYDDEAQNQYADEERGLILQTEQSLVGVSSTVTHHGSPLLSYTRTMSRFYANRRQRLSLGRYNCEVCGERIRMWAWETPNGGRTHDGCYDRLAWTWTNLYAQQQRLASQGQLE